jgi:two-component system sensor histidine kinase FlrB
MVDNKQVEREKKLLAMGEMAASLAHEIRNPLGSMELYCSLLKKNLKAMPNNFEIADQIHQGIKRLDRIIANCLQFSRDVQLRPVVLADWAGYLDSICKDARDSAERQGVTVSIDTATSRGGTKSVTAKVDKHLLHQAVLNLLINAIDAAAGSKQSAVNIEVTGTETEVFISVSDSGPGISDEIRDRIFDPFFTTKDSGTGLGLAIVHSIVSTHGGGLVVENGREHGAIFTICLPRNLA